MRFQLRPYQNEAIDRVRTEWRNGRRKVVVVSPTGSGKTVLACSMVESAVAKGSRVIFLTHRCELVDNVSEKLDDNGIDHGIVMADHKRWKPWCPIQVVSIPTVIRRLGNRPQAHLVIVDECHHARSESWEKVLACYPEAAVVGLSATPARLDGKGLKSIFNGMVVVAQPAELESIGFLMAPRLFCPDKPNLSRVKIRGGDFALDELEAKMNQRQLVGNIVKEWQRLGAGRRTLVFAVSIAHSTAIRDRFREAGITAEHVDGTTPKDERKKIVAALKEGKVQVVSNCALFGEGVDIVELGVVSLARPTKSLTLFLQQCGRALRPAPGKEQPIIIDHADSVRRFGSPMDDREWSLDDLPTQDRRKPDPDRSKVCKVCMAAVPMTCKVCPECGTPFIANTPAPEETEHKLTEFGIAVCPACGSSNLKTIEREKFGLGRALIVCNQCGHKEWRTSRNVKKATQDEKRREYHRLLAVAKEKGFKPGWAAVNYKAKFDSWPARWV